MVTVIAAESLPKGGRVGRHPQHSFHIRTRPWQIQPFCIAPVLPGETMKNLLLQARIVTDPIKNPLIGWWAEYYFFYIKHRDLDERDTLTAMMLDSTTSVAALRQDVLDTDYYAFDDAIDWSRFCLKRVVEEYFREEGETWNANLVGNMPAASIWSRNWWGDSVLDSTLMPTVADLPEDAPTFDAQYEMWQFQRAQKLTNMTYEQWLQTYGVKPNREELHKPELIRYVRDWQYPSNTVEPTTGVPSSAVSWAVAERADKDRFFREPGFIFGVSVMRPKVYLSGQTGSAVGLLDNALAWLPALLREEVYTSLKLVAAGDGPLQSTTNPYWVDLRDLFLYGDQFINFALSDTAAGLVALPTAALEKRYATGTMADTLFAAAAPANQIRMDGVVNLSIQGTQVDYT